MSESLRDLIGRIIDPPTRAVPPAPAGLTAIPTERLETLLGWVISRTGAPAEGPQASRAAAGAGPVATPLIEG